jgi:hypothetical protein
MTDGIPGHLPRHPSWHLDGVKFIVSNLLPVRSMKPHPRSPGRAKRRAALGHRQHMREVVGDDIMQVGDIFHISPAVWEELKRITSAPMEVDLTPWANAMKPNFMLPTKPSPMPTPVQRLGSMTTIRTPGIHPTLRDITS